MPNRLTGSDLRQIHTLYNLGRIGLLTDGQLLERFATGDGETAELAFTALVERHGPMVLGVCSAVLGDADAARDAFQATFLVLLRKARSLWVKDSLGPWLYRVAHRAAQKARSSADRRRFHERRAAELRATSDESGGDGDDLMKVLHEEMTRLPIRYRMPMVLCDLEGRTHEEASKQMGCPVGTVKSRLARGRERLRGQLLRRGIGLSTVGITTLTTKGARAAIPEALIKGTMELAREIGAHQAAVGVVPTAAVILSRGVHRSMFLARWARIAAFAVMLGSLALGVGIVKRQDEAALRQQALTPARTITIQVVGEDGNPIGGVPIFKHHIYRAEDNERTLIEDQDVRTDVQGKALLNLSGTSVELSIEASHKGFVPLHAMWAKQFQSDGDQIPEEFTFNLERGTEIGGTIVDEQGKPIEGVKVEVRDRTAYRFLNTNPEAPGQRPIRPVSLAEGPTAMVTDAQGRWTLENVPPDKDLSTAIGEINEATPTPPNGAYGGTYLAIELHFSHPDYISDEVEWGRFQTLQSMTLESLREQTAKLVLFRK